MLKIHVRMATNNTPLRSWDFALVYEAEILSMIARRDDLVPGLEKITGEIVDITEYLDFAFILGFSLVF